MGRRIGPSEIVTPRTSERRASFFFQAEDGIRDGRVTGVQTCALPILLTLQADGTSTSCASDPHFTGTTVNQVTAADGTSQPFSIPAGQVFIVTGFNINAYGAAANQDVDIALGRQGGASENSIVHMDVIADVNGIATFTRTLSPGAVVKPGVTLCVRAGRLGGLPAFPTPVQVYGFFAPDA